MIKNTFIGWLQHIVFNTVLHFFNFYFLNVTTMKVEIKYIAQSIFHLDRATLRHGPTALSEFRIRAKARTGN